MPCLGGQSKLALTDPVRPAQHTTIHVTSMNRDKRALCMRRSKTSLDMTGLLNFDCYILGGLRHTYNSTFQHEGSQYRH